jgi:uncharacterized protein DUF4238
MFSYACEAQGGSVVPTDHPHARGENDIHVHAGDLLAGPSPRAWGKHRRPRVGPLLRGRGRNVLMADGRTRRMHTVPEGYFEAFAVQEAARRTSCVWRFDRTNGQAKLLGIGDAEVVKDIYTVFSDEGAPDTGIEDELLCGLEGSFCTARKALLNRMPLSKETWAGLARFIAAQLLRTPRFFQLMRDGLEAGGTAYEQDSLPRVMLLLIERWIPRLVRMRGILAYNETGLPLLTCDNPAVTCCEPCWTSARVLSESLTGSSRESPRFGTKRFSGP